MIKCDQGDITTEYSSKTELLADLCCIMTMLMNDENISVEEIMSTLAIALEENAKKKKEGTDNGKA